MVANWVIWILFASEGALLLGFAPDRRGWARGHKLELAVVTLTPPLSAGRAPIVRLLRPLRLAVAVKLARNLFALESRWIRPGLHPV